MSKFFKILMLGACSVLFVPWQCTSDEFHQQRIENLSSDSQPFKISEAKQYYSKLIYQNQPNGSFQKNRTSNILLNIDWSKEIPNFGSFKKAHSLGLNTHLIGNYNLVSKLLFVKSSSAQIGVKLISWYSFDDKINWNSFNGYVFITDIFGEIEEVYRIEEGLTRKKITPIMRKNISELNFIKNENQTRNKEACATNPDILCELGETTTTLTTSKPRFPVEFIFPPDELGGGDDEGGTESGDVDVDEGGGSSSGNSTNPDNNEDPCIQMYDLMNESQAKVKISEIRTKMQEDIQNAAPEQEHSSNLLSDGSFTEVTTHPGGYSNPVPPNTVGQIHSHPESNTIHNSNSFFSGTDLFIFITQLKYQCTRSDEVFSILVLKNRTFTLRFSGSGACNINLNNFTTEKLNDSYLGKSAENARSGRNLARIAAMLETIQETGINGIELYETNEQGQSTKKTLNNNTNEIQDDDC